MTGKHAHTDAAVSVPVWIPLLRAYAHVTRIVGAPASSHVRLRQALDDRGLRHLVGLAYDGFPQRREMVNTTAPDGFWRSAQIDWAEDRAVRSSPRFEAHRVVVAEQDLLKLWPERALLPEVDAPTSGRKRKYHREEIVTVAAEYIAEYRLPGSQSKLIDKVSTILGDAAPGDTLMKEIIGPFYKRIKAASDRRQSGRK
jgi:hypothetical protein